jgi:hypothetical protein
VTDGPDQEAEPEQDEEEPRRDLEVARLPRAVVWTEEIGHQGDEGGEHGGESILRTE